MCFPHHAYSNICHFFSVFAQEFENSYYDRTGGTTAFILHHIRTLLNKIIKMLIHKGRQHQAIKSICNICYFEVVLKWTRVALVGEKVNNTLPRDIEKLIRKFSAPSLHCDIFLKLKKNIALRVSRFRKKKQACLKAIGYRGYKDVS